MNLKFCNSITMVRAIHLPSVSSPALNALRFSLIPALSFPSPPPLSVPRNSSTSALPLVIIRNLRIPRSSHLRSFCSDIGPAVAAHPRTRARASYSTGIISGGGREILVQHLLVKEDDRDLLLDIQKRVTEGEDLSDLAVEHSICPSKEKGGMLGWVRKGQMVPEFEEAAFSAPLNNVVRCKTKFGWHLLQVLSEREELQLLEIEPAELHSKLQDSAFLDGAQLIDVREPEEVAQASLPGFQVLPLQQFGRWAPEINTKFDPDKETYVMCHHGMRSLQMAKWLQTQGFKRVFNVVGGIHAYAVQADPSVPTY